MSATQLGLLLALIFAVVAQLDARGRSPLAWAVIIALLVLIFL